MNPYASFIKDNSKCFFILKSLKLSSLSIDNNFTSSGVNIFGVISWFLRFNSCWDVSCWILLSFPVVVGGTGETRGSIKIGVFILFNFGCELTEFTSFTFSFSKFCEFKGLISFIEFIWDCFWISSRFGEFICLFKFEALFWFSKFAGFSILYLIKGSTLLFFWELETFGLICSVLFSLLNEETTFILLIWLFEFSEFNILSFFSEILEIGVAFWLIWLFWLILLFTWGLWDIWIDSLFSWWTELFGLTLLLLLSFLNEILWLILLTCSTDCSCFDIFCCNLYSLLIERFWLILLFWLFDKSWFDAYSCVGILLLFIRLFWVTELDVI